MYIPGPSACLADLLPHAEPMILIAAVLAWDNSKISCEASSHLAADNPLRQQGILSVYAGVEYAAQAMAVHARLVAPETQRRSLPRKGFLAVASKLVAQVADLDQVKSPLVIELEQIAANNDSSLYRFAISAAGQNLLEGQLMAVIEAAPAA